jgi:hypothetical protein
MFRLSVIFVFIFCATNISFAQEGGIDLFIKSCQMQGENINLISSGHVEALFYLKDNRWGIPMTYSAEQLEKMITEHGSIEKRDEYIHKTNKQLQSLAEKGSTRKLDVLFQRKSTMESFYKATVSETDKGHNEYQFITRFLQKRKNDKLDINIDWAFDSEIHIKTQQFNETNVWNWRRIQGKFVLFATFSLLGESDRNRFLFPKNNVDQFKQVAALNPEAFQLTGETKYDDDALAKIIEVRVKGKLLQRY